MYVYLCLPVFLGKVCGLDAQLSSLYQNLNILSQKVPTVAPEGPPTGAPSDVPPPPPPRPGGGVPDSLARDKLSYKERELLKNKPDLEGQFKKLKNITNKSLIKKWKMEVPIEIRVKIIKAKRVDEWIKNPEAVMEGFEAKKTAEKQGQSGKKGVPGGSTTGTPLVTEEGLAEKIAKMGQAGLKRDLKVFKDLFPSHESFAEAIFEKDQVFVKEFVKLQTTSAKTHFINLVKKSEQLRKKLQENPQSRTEFIEIVKKNISLASILIKKREFNTAEGLLKLL